MSEWCELEEKGYVVVRGFLNEEQLAPLRADFSRGRPAEDFPYGFKLVRPRVLNRLWPHLEKSLQQIREQTSLKADMLNCLSVSHYITTRLATRSSYLHQDFDMDFRLTGDHHHMLNFWLPIIKQEASLSNLSVVPLDALKARSEKAWKRLEGGGGSRLISKDGRTGVYSNNGQIFADDETMENPEFWLDFDIEELVETPHLEAGDLLLLRGDLPHRTQDIDSERVAASIRVTYSGKTIPRERVGPLVSGDPAQTLLSKLTRCFAAQGGEQISLADFLSFQEARL